MLRRPPTRIELNVDDIEEYDELKKELLIHTESSKYTESARTEKKKSAAQRVGYTKHTK